MRGQTKTSGEERLEDNQLAFWLGDLLRPRDMCHSAAKITKLLHVLHANRGHRPFVLDAKGGKDAALHHYDRLRRS